MIIYGTLPAAATKGRLRVTIGSQLVVRSIVRVLRLTYRVPGPKAQYDTESPVAS